jgi:hypothetical protein
MIDELEVRPMTLYPIEKHALVVYTRDIYLRFILEFELIGWYNVQVLAPNMYYLVPNNLRFYPYGGEVIWLMLLARTVTGASVANLNAMGCCAAMC